MAINQETIEWLAAWCFNAEEIAEERQKAWACYFGEDDPRPVEYWRGAEERNTRERRFLGWFMFDYTLPSGEKPAEVAAKRLYTAGTRIELLKAIAGTRHVNAVVSSVIGRSVFLQLEDESFEVRSRIWAANLARNQAIVAHIVPVRRRYWLPGPGWTIWPVSIGPGLRESMRSFQIDPIATERFLQGRSEPEEEGKPQRDVPRDRTFEAAVSRMTNWAQQHDYYDLVLSSDQWRALILEHMRETSPASIFDDLTARIGKLKSDDDLQVILDLCSNIWNNTPQPDRGGKSARQLSERYWGSSFSDENA